MLQIKKNGYQAHWKLELTAVTSPNWPLVVLVDAYADDECD